MKRFLRAAATVAFLAGAGASALATDLSFTGDLAGDNDVQLFSFRLTTDTDVTLRTWSYAGGTNAAGSVIGAGGFDAVLALFSGTGGPALLIGGNDDGFGVATDPGTGLAYDALLEAFALPAGDYTVALTNFANFANGPTLDDGFLGAGEGGFNGRSSAWALDILGADSASVIPESGTLALAGLGLCVAGLARRRTPATA